MGFASWLSDVVAAFSNNPASAVLTTERIRRERDSLRALPVRLLSEGIYMDAFRRGHITKVQFIRYMAELGFSSNQSLIAYNTAKAKLSAIEAATNRIANSYKDILNYHDKSPETPYNQNRLNQIKDKYCKAMYDIGYDSDESEKLFNTLRPVPTFSILLEWLAKEAFEPDVITEFDLDADYPAIFNDIMTALGVPESEAKKYWIAHWNHPPMGQILQMYQKFGAFRIETIDNGDGTTTKIDDRSTALANGANTTLDKLTITEKQIRDMAKLHEFPTWWVERMIANSFNQLPYTSLQQLYQYGLRKDTWFRGRLRDYGYSLDDANALLETWRRKYPFRGKERLSLNLYQQIIDGNADAETVYNELVTEHELPPDDAKYFVDVALDKKYLKEEKIAIRAAQKLIATNAATAEQIATSMKPHFRSPERFERAWELIELGTEGVFSRIRIRDISRGLREKTITPDDARTLLTELRLHEPDIDVLLGIYSEVYRTEQKDGNTQ